MRSYDIPKEVLQVATKDFTIKTQLQPEYVLKVNNAKEKDKVQAKSVEPKSNPYSKNLPIVRKRFPGMGRKAVVLTMFFILFFLLAVIVGYNAVFFLFTI